jgi:hypothetical protein
MRTGGRARHAVLFVPDRAMCEFVVFHEVVYCTGYDLLASHIGVTIGVFEVGLNISVLQPRKRINKGDAMFFEQGLQLASNFAFGIDLGSVQLITRRVMHFFIKDGFFGRQ